MSITQLMKLVSSPKLQQTMKIVMNKGFTVREVAVPRTVLKQFADTKEMDAVFQKLGYKNVTFKGGIKGAKEGVTTLLQAYSGKNRIGYVAAGIDAKGAKPILQMRGEIMPKGGKTPVRFNWFADGNKPALTEDLADLSLNYKRGKTVASLDTGAVKANFSGDLTEIQNAYSTSIPGVKNCLNKLQHFTGKINQKYAELFKPQ